MNRPRLASTHALWALLLPATIATIWISMASYDHAGQVPTNWIVTSAFTGVFLLAWVDGEFRWRRAALITAVCTVASSILGPPLGFGAAESVRILLLSSVVQVCMMLLYRIRATNAAWFPESPARVLDLAALQTLGACIVVAVGGVPYLWWGADGTLSATILWCVRTAGNMIFAAFVSFSWLMPPNPTYSRHEYQRYLPLIVPLCGFCLVVPFLLPPFPLDWVILVPAVAIGVTMTPRTVGLAAVAAAALPTIFRDSPHWRIEPGHLVHPFSVMEMLLVSALLLSYVLVAFRERRARLVEETRAAANQAAAQTELLRSVVQTMSDGVLLTDTAGRIVLANPAARTMLGRPSAHSPQDDWASSFDFRAAGGTALTEEQIRELLAPPTEGHARMTVTVPAAAGGDLRYFTLTARGLTHRHDRLNLVLISDVTAEHSRRRELESFAATVAHDLKNPLASLTTWMDLADAELDDDLEAGQHALAQAHESSRRMSTMIDEYLNYTVTREGILRPVPVDLAKLVGEIATAYGHGDGAPILDVQVEDAVQADHALLSQLLGNLIGNAVKYSHPDQPTHIQIRAIADSSPGWVRIQVADKGVGIEPEDVETIFKPFARSASGAARGQGIGLGLALCHAIVTRHGGTISASNNDWGGATFSFTLPRAGAFVS